MASCHAHDDVTCLCDVVITQPVEVANIDFGRDSYYSTEIIRHLGLSSPMSDDDILAFFAFQADLKDRMWVAEHTRIPLNISRDGKANPMPRQSKLTDEMKQFIAMQVINGSPSAAIRAEVTRIYGVDLTATHMSQLRKRLVKRDTL